MWCHDQSNGGDIAFSVFEELVASFAKEEIHPGDIKFVVEKYINRLAGYWSL